MTEQARRNVVEVALKHDVHGQAVAFGKKRMSAATKALERGVIGPACWGALRFYTHHKAISEGVQASSLEAHAGSSHGARERGELALVESRQVVRELEAAAPEVVRRPWGRLPEVTIYPKATLFLLLSDELVSREAIGCCYFPMPNLSERTYRRWAERFYAWLDDFLPAVFDEHVRRAAGG